MTKSHLIFVLLACMLCACGSGGHHPETVTTTIAAYRGDIDEPEAAHLTADTQSLPLDGNPAGPFVQTRLAHLQHRPCDQCHQPNSNKPPRQAAHWDITLKHGAKEVMNCVTCHDKSVQMTQLKTLTDQPVAFDNAYDLCGQCHFEQKRDWQGGAHGKRIAAWAGKRVIANCTTCHDPHQPGFPQRLPAMAPGRINTRAGSAH